MNQSSLVCLIGCLCIVFNLFAKPPGEVEILREKIAATTDGRQQAKYLQDLGSLYYYIQLDSARLFAEQSLKLAEQELDWNLQAEAYELIGDLYEANYLDDPAIENYQKAYDIYAAHSTEESEIKRILVGEQIEYLNGENGNIIKKGLELINFFKKRNDTKRLFITYQLLADTYFNQGLLERSEHYDSLQMSLTDVFDSQLVTAARINQYGYTCYKNLDFEKAAQLYEQSMKMTAGMHCPITQGNQLFNVALLNQTTDKADEVYPLLEEARQFFIKGGSSFSANLATGSIGYHYLNNEQPAKALPYIRQAMEYSSRLVSIGWYYGYVEDMGEAFAALGQYDSAYHYSILNLNNERTCAEREFDDAIAKYQSKFETTEKETQIRIQQAVINQKNTVIWLIGSFLLITTLLGAALFYLTRILKQRNQEKEFLNKEIHHRVKNNLQVLSSLLYLQSHHTEDTVAGDALREGQNRVQAMGLIHQKLYTTDDLTTVDMDTYTRDLTETLIDALGANPQQIEVNYQIQDLQLDVDTAIPLGLILNELITNSIKYAFAHAQSGELKISLFTNDRAHLVLQVRNKTDESYPTHQQAMGTGFGSNLIHILGQKMQGTPVITQTENSYQTEIIFQRWQQSTPESFATTAP